MGVTSRGAPCLRVVGSHIEMGAFEVQIRGDMNFDGNVDMDDIEGFVLGLNDPIAYEARYGAPPRFAGDMDADGDQDFDDIDDFVALLNNQPVALGARASVETKAFERERVSQDSAGRPAVGFRRGRETRAERENDDQLASVWSDDVDWLAHAGAKSRKRGRIALEFWE